MLPWVTSVLTMLLIFIRPIPCQALMTRFDWNIITVRLENIYFDSTGKVHAV